MGDGEESEKTEQRRLRIGCSGWSYDFWEGGFYPIGTPKGAFLEVYSSVFDVVEVDSTFYRIPPPPMVAGWDRATPADFRFTAKFPKVVTHEHKLRRVQEPLQRFYDAFDVLGRKLDAFVVQLPPSLKYDRDRDALETFLGLLRKGIPHAVEFRHKSWFRDDVYALLADHDVSLAWSTTQYLDTPPEVTGDLLYLRMIGDRSLEKLGTLQKDRTDEMAFWSERVQEHLDDVSRAYVFFNNHFAGFGPGSVNEFRRLLGLIEREFPKSGQKTLAEF